MSNVIENLGKLDRKVTLAIPKAEVEKVTKAASKAK